MSVLVKMNIYKYRLIKDRNAWYQRLGALIQRDINKDPVQYNTARSERYQG